MVAVNVDWRVQWSLLLANIIQSMRTESAFHSLCEMSNCQHGSCYIVNSSIKCACEEAYNGDRCQNVDLSKIKIIVVGTTVVFQWEHPPRLSAFTLIYYKFGSQSKISKRSILMRNNDYSLIIGDLQGSLTHYRVCVESDALSYKIGSISSANSLKNCVDVVTKPDYHSIAAWCLLLLLVCVILLLMYSQKNKIEILYFATPVYVPRYLQDENILTQLNNLNVVNEVHNPGETEVVTLPNGGNTTNIINR